MKGGKEENKIMEPLFPRLHVNDTGKGGPRAPPRNKMALYEQFSIPSQRFNSSVSSSSCLPLQKGSTLVPSSSSSQSCRNEKSILLPLDERVPSVASDKMNLNTTRMDSERRSRKHARYSTSNANTNNSRGRNIEDEDDFRVPTFIQSGITTLSGKNLPTNEREKSTPFCSTSPQKSCSPPFPHSSDNIKSRNHDGNHGEENPRENYVIKESTDMPEFGGRSAEQSKFTKTFSHGDHKDTANGTISQYRSTGLGSQREDRSNSNRAYANAPRDGHCNANAASNCNRENDDNPNGSVEPSNASQNDEVSEVSMVDSISGMELLSPDVVVGVIGAKHFWKARRAIVSQQRIFAVQVFELHRLMKVQKLIATCPLVPYVSPEKVPTKNLTPKNIEKSLHPSIKQKDPTEENSAQDPSPATRPSSGNTVVIFAAPNQSPNPCCFHPPPSQWLVPVMSPSEGLIYKPYTGPCPPAAGFMAPFYGSCTPLAFPPMPGSHQQQNYLPTPYGLSVGWEPNGHDSEHYQITCNVSKQNSKVLKSQASKESDQRGSTTSRHENAQEVKNAMPLFAMSRDSEGANEPVVIRVVPHKARSARESAARIFRSIQKEREQYDS